MKFFKSVLALTIMLLPLSARAELSADELHQRSIERHAIEAAIWGMPAVNYDLMLQEMINKTKGKTNQIVYWSRLLDAKNQTLTPNPDSIYLIPFFNTKDVGPIVIEVPPADGAGSINGTIMDVWQTPLEDVGPAGADKGKGGKYLILPPGYKEKAPEGYIVLPFNTNQGYALMRSILNSGSQEAAAKGVEYGRRIKLYPLSQAENPPETVYVDAADLVYDATIQYDFRFFESLNRIIQEESWLTRDKIMIDYLKSIGIEKGKPFNPDDKTKAILNAAMSEVHAFFEKKYETFLQEPFFDGSRWGLPASIDQINEAGAGYTAPDFYPIEDRGVVYTYAFFAPKHLGQGQFYLMTIKDKDGQDLSGSNTYRLNVPAKAPVRLYWSATAYDRATHALIHDQTRVSRASISPGLQKNKDGSVDIFFGPKAPEGKETNWVATDPKGEFEILFRLYGPEKALFEKTWKLPDLEKTN